MSGRIRTIKPELLEDERVAALSDGAFRLFIAAILSADDYGNFRAEPRQLRGLVYWGRDDVAAASVQSFREELLLCGLIAGYRVRGQTYAHISGWSKHQRMDNAGKARMPKMNDAAAEPFRVSPETRPSTGMPAAESADDDILAASRGEPPRVAANLGEPGGQPESSPLARALPDLRPTTPTNDPEGAGLDLDDTRPPKPRIPDPAGDEWIAKAYAEGIRDVTGAPGPVLAPKLQRQLADAVHANVGPGRPVQARLDFARDTARRFAERVKADERGKPFKYLEALASGVLTATADDSPPEFDDEHPSGIEQTAQSREGLELLKQGFPVAPRKGAA